MRGIYWLARLARGWRLDRNPLRRACDRAETVALGALLVVFLAAVPFAAQGAGSWAYAVSAREAQAQRATLHQVPATLTQASSQPAFYLGAGPVPFGVGARWRAPDGRVQTGELFVQAGAAAGTTVPVWVDRAGRLAGPPFGRAQLAARAQLAQELTALALGIALAAAMWLTRRGLDRRRMAAWDADWLATGPRWSSRR